MKKILVPTDFSACSRNAIDFAVQTAKYLPVEITLLHAFELTGNVYTDYMGVNSDFNQSLLDDVHEKLKELQKAIEDTEGIHVSTYVAVTPLLTAILDVIAEKSMDLVVMSTLGASGIKGKIWGSKTAALIGKTKVPVLVIPYEYVWKKPSNILFATNHFEKSASMLDPLFEMADLYMAKVQVAVFTDEDDDTMVTSLEHARKISQYEEFLKEQYQEETLTAAHLYGLAFEETLQGHIKDNDIDMVAMISYQKERSFWERLFHRSQTKRMSYHTNIPLLAIPAT